MTNKNIFVYTNYSKMSVKRGGDCKRKPYIINTRHPFVAREVDNLWLRHWVLQILSKWQNTVIVLHGLPDVSILDKIDMVSGFILVKTEDSHDYSFRHPASTYNAMF